MKAHLAFHWCLYNKHVIFSLPAEVSHNEAKTLFPFVTECIYTVYDFLKKLTVFYFYLSGLHVIHLPVPRYS